MGRTRKHCHTNNNNNYNNNNNNNDDAEENHKFLSNGNKQKTILKNNYNKINYTNSNHNNSDSNNINNEIRRNDDTTEIIKSIESPNISNLLLQDNNGTKFITKLDNFKNVAAYRAEGNANLVISLPEFKHVLRLRKCKISTDMDNKGDDKMQEDESNLSLFVEYIKFISKLIGMKFTNEPKLVEIILSDYDAFNNWLRPHRPAERLDKDVRCRFGMLYPDVAFLPEAVILKGIDQNIKAYDTFCVEIKPKQGWMFHGENNMQHSNIKLVDIDGVKKCRFCSMQYLKLQKKAIRNVSSYCPMDLFSGNPVRMTRAIKALVNSPQNNFAIFRNGNLMYNNKTEPYRISSNFNDIFGTNSLEENYSKFCRLLIKILLNEFKINGKKEVESSGFIKLNGNSVMKSVDTDDVDNDNDSYDGNKSIGSCIESKLDVLPENCILRRILNIQLLAKTSMSVIDKFEETDQPYSYINNLLTKTANFDGNMEKLVLEHLNDNEKYLLGATALDCSMMLSFTRVSDRILNNNVDETVQQHLIDLNGTKFLVKAIVMDLDPKTGQHYGKYIRQTDASHLAYKDFFKIDS